MPNEITNLNEEWREFLSRDLDARRVVNALMSRTGFGQDEVPVYLLDVWAEWNLMPEEQRESQRPASRH